MIIFASFSKPAGDCTSLLERPYIRIKVKSAVTGTTPKYMVELFTQKQAFHQTWTPEQLDAFIQIHAGKTFRNCIYRTEKEETTILGNKKGHITTLTKALKESSTTAKIAAFDTAQRQIAANHNRTKNYIMKEGIPIPFLIHLGVMTPNGKIIASKYDKFRQINRFLEYIDDILAQVLQQVSPGQPLRITDFGCGKSYLTFAVYHFVTEIKKIPAKIIGLDLKEDVIVYCNNLAKQFGYDNLHFAVGDIAQYQHKYEPDIVITLHACDTATDYALAYAVKHNTKAIISVPCCQHEINQQLDKNKDIETTSPVAQAFAPLLQYGIIKERFAALITDALRSQYLEQAGYKVQVLEFIDMAHTPKNLLIRAVKKTGEPDSQSKKIQQRTNALTQALHLEQTLKSLLF